MGFENKEWKFSNSQASYCYDGRILRGDDAGNIHFGNVGSVYFPLDYLLTGAGVYQMKTDYINPIIYRIGEIKK